MAKVPSLHLGFTLCVVQCYEVFFFLVVWYGVWDLSSQPGVKLVSPVLGVHNLNHWTAREVPVL